MGAIAEIDVSGVNRMIGGLHHALIGTGGNGDLAEVTKDETRKLALECGGTPTPRQRQRIEKNIRRDIGKVFLPAPKRPLHSEASNGVHWINAGPNFLTGVPDDRWLLDQVSGNDARFIFYRSKDRLPKRKFEDVGKRGKQHVQIVQRFVVGKNVMAWLFQSLKKKVGKRDASFAETAQVLGGAKIPSGTKRHFPTGKNITRPKLEGSSPEITFGSNALGVDGLKDKVESKVKIREKKMYRRLQLILTGYAQDNNSGSTIKRHAK